MIIAVDFGRKATKQTKNQIKQTINPFFPGYLPSNVWPGLCNRSTVVVNQQNLCVKDLRAFKGVILVKCPLFGHLAPICDQNLRGTLMYKNNSIRVKPDIYLAFHRCFGNRECPPK